MKRIILAALALTFTPAISSAQELFDPNLGSALPAGYSESTNTDPSGTFTTSSSGLTVGDFSQVGPYDQALNNGAGGYDANETYVSSTVASVGSDSIYSSFTFTPTYSLQGNGGGQGNITLFSLTTATANNPLFSVTLQPFTYSGTDNLVFGGSVQYGVDSSSSGSGYYSSSEGAPPLGSLSGKTLTVNDVTTSTDLGPNTGPGFTAMDGDRFSVENKGTLYEGTTLLFSFDFTSEADTANQYNPNTGALTLDFGIVNGSSDKSSDDAATNYFAPDATIDFSNIQVAAPEPSTCALMLGGFGLLVVMARRSARA
jgi:hypothetical protein